MTPFSPASNTNQTDEVLDPSEPTTTVVRFTKKPQYTSQEDVVATLDDPQTGASGAATTSKMFPQLDASDISSVSSNISDTSNKGNYSDYSGRSNNSGSYRLSGKASDSSSGGKASDSSSGGKVSDSSYEFDMGRSGGGRSRGGRQPDDEPEDDPEDPPEDDPEDPSEGEPEDPPEDESEDPPEDGRYPKFLPQVNKPYVQLPTAVDPYAANRGFIQQIARPDMYGNSGVGAMTEQFFNVYSNYNNFPFTFSEQIGTRAAKRLRRTMYGRPMLDPTSYMTGGLSVLPLGLQPPVNEAYNTHNQIALLQQDAQNFMRYASVQI
jgi:hypothetical protein